LSEEINPPQNQTKPKKNTKMKTQYQVTDSAGNEFSALHETKAEAIAEAAENCEPKVSVEEMARMCSQTGYTSDDTTFSLMANGHVTNNTTDWK